jgi:quercetin dioxygenase-like cupin family protein
MAEQATPRNTEIQKIHIDPNAKPNRMLSVPGGKVKSPTKLYWFGPAIRTPEASVACEDFAAGSTVHWFFDYTEAQYILSGKAEITYRLAPLYVEEKTFTAEAGDAYVIPKGAIIEFKIDPSGPFRKFCVIMPGFRPDLYFANMPKDLREKVYKEGEIEYE